MFWVALGLEVCSTANPSAVGKAQGSAPVAKGAGHGLGSTKLFSRSKAGALGESTGRAMGWLLLKSEVAPSQSSSSLAGESCNLGSLRCPGLLKDAKTLFPGQRSGKNIAMSEKSLFNSAERQTYQTAYHFLFISII